MKILTVHNRYQYPGGEDMVTEAERQMMELNGDEVVLYERHNDEINDYAFLEKISLFFRPTWSFSARSEIEHILQTNNVDVVHVQNLFPLISPSVLYACFAAGVPVVFSVHNWRILCANGLFYRYGQICTECLEYGLLSAIRYGCYRNSRLQSAAVFLMQKVHNYLRTWHNLVDMFIAPTQFIKGQFVRAGFETAKIMVKPHFVYPDPGARTRYEPFALFVGRLVENKGIRVLLEAWKEIDIPLKVVGTGPLEEELKNHVDKENLDTVELCGQRSTIEVIEYMKRSSIVIVPSLHYEAFGRIIVEAFACGVPVLASRREPLTEIIENRKSGLLFEPGNSSSIVEQVRWLTKRPKIMRDIGLQARQEFESKYTAQVNYKHMINIYQHAMENKRRALEQKRSNMRDISVNNTRS